MKVMRIALAVLTMMSLSTSFIQRNASAEEMSSEIIEISAININTASAEELQTISGIGPTIATRIIQYRTDNGKFSSVDDIMNVRGVGVAKFQKIKDYLAV